MSNPNDRRNLVRLPQLQSAPPEDGSGPTKDGRPQGTSAADLTPEELAAHRRERAVARALAAAKKTPTPNAEQEQAFAIQEINTAKLSVLGMILFAQDHGDQFPTNFDQAENYFGGPNGLRTNMNRFEIVYQGSWTNLANPSSAIVVREIQPWSRNGKWVKAYGFGDGHAEAHSEASANFDEWEQQHAPVLKNQ